MISPQTVHPATLSFPHEKKDAILAKFKAEKVIALIRADNPDGLLDCAQSPRRGRA